MTFEEIREMVNATITENGQRQITGKALNLALMETLTAVEEYLANNKSEGAGTEIVYLVDDMDTMELTPEHQASNAAVYAKVISAMAEGRTIPILVADTTIIERSYIDQEGQNSEGLLFASAMPDGIFLVDPQSPVSEEYGTGLVIYGAYNYCINEDGTILAII